MIASAYALLASSSWDERHYLWMTISRCPRMQLFRQFFWLLGHGCLFTNSYQYRIFSSTSNFCRSCLREEETVIHALRDCVHV